MPGLVPRPASQRRSQTPRTRTLAFESANSSTCGDDRPSTARTSSQGRTPVHGRGRAREHPSSSHAHGNGAQARAKSTARMGGAPEGGGPPRAAIQRGPCPKVPAEFDRRPLAGARGRLCLRHTSTGRLTAVLRRTGGLQGLSQSSFKLHEGCSKGLSDVLATLSF